MFLYILSPPPPPFLLSLIFFWHSTSEPFWSSSYPPSPCLSCISRFGCHQQLFNPLPQAFPTEGWLDSHDNHWAGTLITVGLQPLPLWTDAATPQTLERNIVQKRMWPFGKEGFTSCCICQSHSPTCTHQSSLFTDPHHLRSHTDLPLRHSGISWLKSLRNFTGLFPGPKVHLVTLGL